MASFNSVTLIGRLGRDPELRYTTNGTAVSTFSIATSEIWKDGNGDKQERTDWHNIQLWKRLAELSGEYLRKGSLVLISGQLRTDKWEKDGKTHYKTYVVGTSMQFLDSKKSERQSAPESAQEPVQASSKNDDDDLPF